jgi:hypothetical protein
MYGLSDDEIAAIREGQLEAFAPAEVVLLRMADAMADTPSNVNDELYAELRRTFRKSNSSSSRQLQRSKTSVHDTTVCSMWGATDCIVKV